MKITSKKYVKLAASIMVRIANLQNAEKDPLVSYCFHLSCDRPQMLQIAKFVRDKEHPTKIAGSKIMTAYAAWASFDADLEALLDTLSQWETDCLLEEEENKSDVE